MGGHCHVPSAAAIASDALRSVRVLCLSVDSQRLHRIWRIVMAPPRDTAGSAGTHQPQQPADAGPGRYNQKSTFRNGTTEEGWFYPTPAALKAAADVRGTRAARESCCLRSIRRPRAQATRKPITRTSSSTATTRTAWCTASEARLPALSPLGLTCVCDPHRPREDSSGNYG